MDEWEKFNETSLCEKEEFYKHGGYCNSDYNHAKRVCKDFERKIWVNIMVCILKVANVFEKLRKICLEIYEVDPAIFLAPGLAWQPALKRLK